MVDVLSLVPNAAGAALAQWLEQRGEPAYRARQILPRLWQRPVGSWDDATELPAALRRALAAALPLLRLSLSARQVSQDGTEKYLWDLGDGEAVESVLIPEGKRRTLCISSQVGCALGCVFCATGRMGFRRNLSVAEIVCQVARGDATRCGAEADQCRFHGHGRAAAQLGGRGRRAHDSQTTPTAWRSARGTLRSRRSASCRVSRSWPDGRSSFAWLSHSTRRRRKLRHALMPIEKKYTLPAVMAALARFRRRVTLEYVLIEGKNDALEQADQLAQLARPLGALGEPAAASPRWRAGPLAQPPGADDRVRAAAQAAWGGRRCCVAAAGSTSAPRAGSYGWNSRRGAKSAPRSTLASSSRVVSSCTTTRPRPRARRTRRPTSSVPRRTTMWVESSGPTVSGALP